MIKPNPENYGLVQADLDSIILFNKNQQGLWGIRWMEALLEKTGEFFGAFLFWIILWPAFAFALLLSPITRLFPKPRHPKQTAFDSYAKACEDYLRGQSEWWTTLSPTQFEHELANSFRRRGYLAALTKVTGDGGIDIELRKNKEFCIVQCKRYAKPVGVAAARELYGVVISYGADCGILACTGGFTKGAREFVLGKPLSLISLEDILSLSEHMDDEETFLSVSS